MESSLPKPLSGTETPAEAVTLQQAPTSSLATLQPQRNRIQSLDAVRGVALLGILMMNIPFFGNPEQEQLPDYMGNTGPNYTTWLTIGTLFEGKMRGLFSLLFGVGIVLFMEKKETGPRTVGDLFHRRMISLLCFGLFNAWILLWPGDILYGYALAGLLVFSFRTLRPRTLVIAAVVCFALQALIYNYASFGGPSYDQLQKQRETYLMASSTRAAVKDSLTYEQKRDSTGWQTAVHRADFDRARYDRQLKAMRGNYWQVRERLNGVIVSLESEGSYFLTLELVGMMLLGMALYHWGWFRASFSSRNYVLMALIGLGFGIPLAYYFTSQTFDFLADVAQYVDTHAVSPYMFYDLERVPATLGFLCLILFLNRLPVLRWVGKAFTAVGRMAFTNYLLQSLLCTLFFYGYGLGMYGRLEYYQLYYVVGAVWLLQLIYSPIWLRYFTMGPLEWVWRRWVYGKGQPLRLPAASITVG